jgi:hypothetical protein
MLVPALTGVLFRDGVPGGTPATREKSSDANGCAA